MSFFKKTAISAGVVAVLAMTITLLLGHYYGQDGANLGMLLSIPIGVIGGHFTALWVEQEDE